MRKEADAIRVILGLVLLLTMLTAAIPIVSAALGGHLAAAPGQPDAPMPAAVVEQPPPPDTPAGDTPQPVSSLPVPLQPDAPDGGEPAGVEGLESFLIYNRSTGRVDKVPALDYIRGALASEMPPTFHSEALAAQAVAAHTWALYNAGWQQEHPDESLRGADFSADPDCDEGWITEERAKERYGDNFSLYWPKICEAADFALGHVLTHDGEIALAVYHSTSAGVTESAENVWETAIPYLIPVESEGDRLAPDFETVSTIPKQEMKELLLTAFPDASLDDGDPAGWISVAERSDGGYVTAAEVGGVGVHGKELRAALSLRSSCLSVSYAAGSFRVTVSGYGHGVGMSQYGADFLARQGADCAEILAHYYPGTALSPVL